MEKLNIKSLTVKFALIGITVITVISAFICFDLRFGAHMSEEAKRVNLAGMERMLMRSMAYNIRSFTEFRPASGDEMSRKSADKAMGEYENTLRILKDGNKDIDPIPEHDLQSRQ